jgi:hypothetical protein
MRRRDFLKGTGSAATIWPFAARAQIAKSLRINVPLPLSGRADEVIE